MIFDFRQSRQRKFLQVGIGTARDLVPEKGGIPPGILLDLCVVAVQRRSMVSLERRNHCVIGPIKQRIGRNLDVLALESPVQRVDDRDVRGHHEMRTRGANECSDVSISRLYTSL